MAFNNQIEQTVLSGTTGSGAFVGSVSAALTGSPTLNAYALAPVTPWVAYTPTFTAFGTPTNIEFWSRRVGDTLEVRGRFRAGTTSGVLEARISLGVNGVDSNVTSSSSVITSIECCGVGAYSRTGAQFNVVLIESNVGYMTFGLAGATNASLTKVSGLTLLFPSDDFSFIAKVPVTTWP